MFLNIVSDDELLTSQIVKTILLVFTGAGIGYHIFRIARSGNRSWQLLHGFFLLLLSAILILVIKEYSLERGLLKKPRYITGTTTGYCSLFARGEGISFDYEIDGVTYSCCNTFHPLSKDSIQVPGGKYVVRFTEKYKHKGRMNFRLTPGLTR